jgi:hypothetical protein
VVNVVLHDQLICEREVLPVADFFDEAAGNGLVLVD